MEILCEIEISTASEKVHNIGGGMYHVNLNQTIPVQNCKELRIAVKNDLTMPAIKKRIDFKMLFGSKAETFDEAKLQTFSVCYSSYDELCLLLESIANNSLAIDRNLKVDFCHPNGSEHNCFNFNCISFI